MKRSSIHITEHALLRFLERVKGIDVQAARAEITKTVERAEDHKSCLAVTSNGFRYVLMNGALVTIKRIDSKKGRAGRARQVKL